MNNAVNQSDFCVIPPGSSVLAACRYVQENSDQCEGGGYLLWTALVVCKQVVAIKTTLTVAGALFCLFLFLALAVVADDFFSPNVTDIVRIFAISPNIAGVTLMAFGNGAPDVLTSLVAVIGAQSPKPGLAIGAIIGGGCFVSMVVTAVVVIVHPLRVMRRPIMRDLSFFLLALIWTGVSFSVSKHLTWWQPTGLLIIYVLYASTVASGRYLWQCQQRRIEKKKSMAAISSVTIGSTDDNLGVERSDDSDSRTYVDFSKDADLVDAHKHTLTTQKSEQLSTSDLPFYATNASEKVFPEEKGVIIRSVSMLEDVAKIQANHVAKKAPEKFDRSAVGKFIRQAITDFLRAVSPINAEDWQEAGILSRVFLIIKAPVYFVFKLSVPLSTEPWCQPLAVLHCIACPMLVLCCFHIITAVPFVNGPPAYALSLMVSAVLVVILLVFTRISREPRYYKVLASLIGFVIAAIWVYFISSEVVSALTMLGVVSKIPQEVIGLTVAAWSNNVGDLVSDVAVARRGVPRMAFTATFAAPLFNLLIGFGVPFIIATTKSTEPVTIDMNTVSKVLFIFLGLSITSSMVLLPLQRWNAGRLYGVYLLVLYAVFIVVVVLAALKIIHF